MQGPKMICATRALKPGPMRIGRIAGDMVLPRTVPLVTLLAGAAGAFLGLVIGASFLGFQGALYFATLIGGLGVAIVTYSPLKGQSLLTWLGLNLMSRSGGRVERDGELFRVSAGICPLPSVPSGRVRVRFGAANIAPSSYDERGAVRSVRNRNLGPMFRS